MSIVDRLLLWALVLKRDFDAYRLYFRWAAYVYAAFVLVGFVSAFNRTYTDVLIALLEALDLLGSFFHFGPEVPLEPTFGAIAMNNLWVMVTTLTGVVVFGVSTFVVLALNGLVGGVVLASGLVRLGPVGTFILIAPHGVLELPAFLAVAAVGFGVPHKTVRNGLSRDGLLSALRLVLVALVLIVIAAWIEAYVTGGIAESVEW